MTHQEEFEQLCLARLFPFCNLEGSGLEGRFSVLEWSLSLHKWSLVKCHFPWHEHDIDAERNVSSRHPSLNERAEPVVEATWNGPQRPPPFLFHKGELSLCNLVISASPARWQKNFVLLISYKGKSSLILAGTKAVNCVIPRAEANKCEQCLTYASGFLHRSLV